QVTLKLAQAQIGTSRARVTEVVAVAAPSPALVLEIVTDLRKLIIVGQHRAAFAGIQIFAGLKAEAARQAPSAHFAAPPLRQVRLASIFNDWNLMLTSDL